MRTLIVALAVTVDDLDKLNLPHVGQDIEEFKRFLTWSGHHVSIVGVLDRDKPENNEEAQIFASESATASAGGAGELRCAC